jgi:branched-chain amino acid transport system substrate-binding protein
LNISFVGSEPLARDLAETDSCVIVTQVIPYPFDYSVPIVREYQADLRALAVSAQAGFGGFEGYIDARIFARALGKIEKPPSREAIIDAFEALGHFDIGLGEELNLSPTEHQASHRVWPTILKDGAFVPFEWTELANLISREAVR